MLANSDTNEKAFRDRNEEVGWYCTASGRTVVFASGIAESAVARSFVQVPAEYTKFAVCIAT